MTGITFATMILAVHDDLALRAAAHSVNSVFAHAQVTVDDAAAYVQRLTALRPPTHDDRAESNGNKQ